MTTNEVASTTTETTHSYGTTIWSTVPAQYHWIIILCIMIASHANNIYKVWQFIGGFRGLSRWLVYGDQSLPLWTNKEKPTTTETK